MRRLFKEIRKECTREEGSATIEFVMLALPLFLPIYIYLGNYAATSDLESSLRTLGREVGRGFVTSENDEIAFNVSEEIFRKGAEILGYGEVVNSGDLTLRIVCQNSPCISPDNKINIAINSKSRNREISTITYTSPWS